MGIVKGNWKAGAVPSQVKCLLCQREKLSSGLQNPQEKPGAVVHAYNPSYGKAEVSGSWGSTSQ